MKVPLNSVVKHNGTLFVYAGVLQERHTLLDIHTSDYKRIEDIQFRGLEVERYPVELAATYILGYPKRGGVDEQQKIDSGVGSLKTDGD